MSKGTGGQAFPNEIPSTPGMTLRDYFAAHAPETPDYQTFPIKQWQAEEVVNLGGGMKGPRMVLKQESWAERAARWSMEYADAMLAERAK